MSVSRLAIGIDLGTTNSAVAWKSTTEDGARAPEVLEVPQLESPGTLVSLKQLPSALYIPFEGEHTAESLRLPWGDSPRYIVGRYAKERASAAPDRVVLSAKSWLCHAQVDRKEKLLPWESSIKEEKLSAFEASAALLAHIREALFAGPTAFGESENPEVVLTVPASFDEAARNLTVEAAEFAGFQRVTLLEEPLAALYSWIARTGDAWREFIEVGDIILVCDVGGGTADFSLVVVSEEEGNLRLQRLSVGNHILLGGDNMDLALAYQLRQKLQAQGHTLDTWQFHSLVHQARKVKERLLSGDDESVPVSLTGKGSSLFASTLQVEARRDEVLALILDGFFPKVARDDLPAADAEGIQEFGLPFEAEPALTRHLAAFLEKSNLQVSRNEGVEADLRDKAAHGALLPNRVLFNGGVFKSPLPRSQVLELLQEWSPELSIQELQGNDFDVAVAEGAAHYARIRSSGEGLRIRAGVPRSYYLGLKSSMPAVPGMRPPVKGICVVEQGMEEGSEVSVENQKFSLLTGKEVEFRFFSSQQRPQDSVGSMLDDAEAELEESSRLSLTLPRAENQQVESVPVELHSKVTDVGTLELWMHSLESENRWKLEFDVRGEKKTLPNKT